MRFSTTQKRLFLRETQFLFFSAAGPVEFCLRPAHIPHRVWRRGGSGYTYLLSPTLPSLPSLSSLPSVSSVKQLATFIHLPYERKYQKGKIQMDI